ncbi:MAG: hypothetical protein ACRDGI_02945 [Candidatus Limnocylindrales bacterium]
MFSRDIHVKSVALLTAVMLVPVLAACSSTPATSSAASSQAAGVPGNPSASSAGPAVAGADVCTSIPQADVQALLAFPITHVADDSSYFACVYTFSGGTTTFSFTWAPDDSDLSSYNTLKGNADHAISGVGDEAYWNEAIPGRSTPSLEAHKGDATCSIQANDPPDVTEKTTQGNAEFTVTDADALAYVQLMGKVCTDVFAAL